MKYIHTPEAKAFLVDGSTWPATINTSLPHFLAKASGMLFGGKSSQEIRLAEGQVLPKMGLYAGIPEISVSPAPVPPRAHPGR